MTTKSVFISELHYNSGSTQSEFLEITVRNDVDISTLDVTFYNHQGNILTTVGAEGQSGGQITLDNAAVSSFPHPTEPNYSVYVIHAQSGSGLFTTTGSSVEARCVALSSSSTGEVFDFFTVGGVSVTAQAGPAAGLAGEPTGSAGSSTSIHWDSAGTRTVETYSIGSSSVVCFVTDTLISTPTGDVAVQDLRQGAQVNTWDAGPQPVVWCAKTRVPYKNIISNPSLWPIRIPKGAFGNGVPHENLNVSPQHRILITPTNGPAFPDVKEVLVPAKKLVGLFGIRAERPKNDISYFHVALKDQSILTSNGALTESFLPGPMALGTLSHNARSALVEALPQIAANDFVAKPCRPVLRGKPLKAFLEKLQVSDDLQLASKGFMSPITSLPTLFSFLLYLLLCMRIDCVPSSKRKPPRATQVFKILSKIKICL